MTAASNKCAPAVSSTAGARCITVEANAAPSYPFTPAGCKSIVETVSVPRPAIEHAIEVLIDLLDTADGDADCESGESL